MDTSEYIEVTLTIEPFSEDNAEITEAELASLPYDSFVIEDETLKAYIPKDEYDPRMLKLTLSALPFRFGISSRLIPTQNWNAQWESEFTPIVIDNTVTVFAPRYTDLKKTRFNIKIQPNMAFGTAHHATTGMMVSRMLDEEDKIKGSTVMDIGCGTGILGILAAKMKAAHVYGIDIDAVAARSAYDNARLNRVGKTFETYYGDASLLQKGSYDVLLANIHRNIIIGDLATYSMSVKQGGILLFSGFYESDIPDIIEAAAKHGLSFCSQKTSEEWALLEFKKN